MKLENMDQVKLSLKKFYEEVGLKYPEEEIVYHTLRGILRKKFIVQRLSCFEGSLLDVGCNRGMYLDIYERGERFGADISLNVLKKASRKKKHLIVADAEDLNCFQAGSFNNVLCSEVIEHCLNPQAVFQSFAYVLKSGGLALITAPSYKKTKPKWIDLGRLPHFGVECECEDGYFHTAYRPEELAEMAKQANFNIIETGFLEKEIKYAAKIPAAVYLFGNFINRFFKSKKFDKKNKEVFDKFMLLVYKICSLSGLEKILMKFVTEGIRSYVLIQKK